MKLLDISSECVKNNYYSDFSKYYQLIKEGIYGPFDPSGIPLVDYDILFKKNNKYGVHYTPVTISEFALATYCLYLKTNEENLINEFLIQANWLKDNLVSNPQGFSVWVHNFEFPIYNLKPGWASAMAQGYGISVLSRAFLITLDKSYLNSAINAATSFKFKIHDGGVISIDNDSNMWFEEFPCYPTSRVLNGHIWATLGLCDLWGVTREKIYLDLISNGLQTVEKTIASFSYINWSLYGLLFKKTASEDYHRMHINQLDIISNLTGNSKFKKYAEKWRLGLNCHESPIDYLSKKINNRFFLPLRMRYKRVRGISYYK